VIIKGGQLMIENRLKEAMDIISRSDLNEDEMKDGLSFAIQFNNEFALVIGAAILGMVKVRRILEEKLETKDLDKVFKNIQPGIDLMLLQGLRSVGLLTTIKCVDEDVGP
jgi:hypothetical protein